MGGFQQIQLRTERRRSWGVSPLVRGSGGSCNLVQEISFHTVKFSQCLVLPTIYDDNLVIVNGKQFEPAVVLEFYCLFSKHLGVLVS